MNVIAEVGSNQKSLEDCLYSIRQAKDVGADAVKFQTFTGKDLYGPHYTGSRELVCDVPVLSMEAYKLGIEFMCTAFSPAGYRAIDKYVRRHKIASSELTAVDILDTVNSFRKPVLLSTGGASNDEIRQALLVLRNVPVTLLYCVVDYPARVVDFRHFDDLKINYGSTCLIGYSDHSTDVLNIPMMAKKRDAAVIEKHANFCGHADTPDAPHSLSTEEFRLMVRHLNGKASRADTKIANPYKRRRMLLKDGSTGYFRPMTNE